jgi:hypothetical protein
MANSEKLGLGIDNPCTIVFLSLWMNKCLGMVNDRHFWNPGVFSYAIIPRWRPKLKVFFLNRHIYSLWLERGHASRTPYTPDYCRWRRTRHFSIIDNFTNHWQLYKSWTILQTIVDFAIFTSKPFDRYFFFFLFNDTYWRCDRVQDSWRLGSAPSRKPCVARGTRKGTNDRPRRTRRTPNCRTTVRERAGPELMTLKWRYRVLSVSICNRRCRTLPRRWWPRTCALPGSWCFRKDLQWMNRLHRTIDYRCEDIKNLASQEAKFVPSDA